MLPNVVRRRTNSLPSLVDDFFNDGFLTGFFTPDHNWRNNWTPAVNVEETDKEYRIDVAAPGLEKNDLKVSVDDGVLKIAYEKKTEQEETINQRKETMTNEIGSKGRQERFLPTP